ncbi:MAG: aminoacyl-tRNA hydrolase [Gammaproteobacteria bacterium]|nr:aminoacyl-tRNA hydrolase [Gammaproteobacteria bacterium]
MPEKARPPAIPPGDYTLSFVRSPGPGGQNVNKVATACELRFPVGAATWLDAAARERLRRLAGRRLTLADEIVIEAHRQRSREGNRRDALDRLEDLIARSLTPPKPRRPTRPSRAVKERRLEQKRHQQRRKRLRGQPALD